MLACAISAVLSSVLYPILSSTELPQERADWLFTLAEYHKMLNNDAEQGRCLVEIYKGFKRYTSTLFNV